MEWNATPSHCVAGNVEGRGSQQQGDQLNVDFVEKTHWDLDLKSANGRTREMAHHRMLVLSQYADAIQHEPQWDATLARKMAWAIVRARAAAQCLGLA